MNISSSGYILVNKRNHKKIIVKRSERDWQSWAAASILGMIAAMSLWYSVTNLIASQKEKENANTHDPNTKLIKIIDPDGTGLADESYERDIAPSDSIAMRYALSVQKGMSSDVVDMTWWMEERLRKVFDSGERERTRAKLREKVLKREEGGNLIRAEGIEDKYIFVPGAGIEVKITDEGLEDLEKEVWQRSWLEVTYSNAATAPRGESENPIRSLVVGVNVSEDGYILKAGVIGNLEIDMSSLSYDWNVEKK